MLSMMIFLQVILPLFDIWILEKEIIFLYLFFVIRTYFVLKRYYFGSIGYGIGVFVAFLLSLILSIEVYLFLFFLSCSDEERGSIGQFWNIDDPFFLIHIIATIIVFHLSLRTISSFLL